MQELFLYSYVFLKIESKWESIIFYIYFCVIIKKINVVNLSVLAYPPTLRSHPLLRKGAGV